MDRTQLTIGIVVIAALCVVCYVAQSEQEPGDPPSNVAVIDGVTSINITMQVGPVIDPDTEYVEMPRGNHQYSIIAVTIEPDT